MASGKAGAVHYPVAVVAHMLGVSEKKIRHTMRELGWDKKNVVGRVWGVSERDIPG